MCFFFFVFFFLRPQLKTNLCFFIKKKDKGKTANKDKAKLYKPSIAYFIAFIFEFLHIDRSLFKSCLVKQGIYIYFFFLHKNTLLG